MKLGDVVLDTADFMLGVIITSSRTKKDQWLALKEGEHHIWWSWENDTDGDALSQCYSNTRARTQNLWLVRSAQNQVFKKGQLVNMFSSNVETFAGEEDFEVHISKHLCVVLGRFKKSDFVEGRGFFKPSDMYKVHNQTLGMTLGVHKSILEPIR